MKINIVTSRDDPFAELTVSKRELAVIRAALARTPHSAYESAAKISAVPLYAALGDTPVVVAVTLIDQIDGVKG